MKISKARITFDMESGDYFFISHQNKVFTLTVSDGGGKPVHFCGISRKQLAGLIYQCEKAQMLSAEESVAALFGDVVDGASSEASEPLAIRDLLNV